MIGIASIYLANRGIEQAERALPVSVAVNVDNLHLTPGQWVIKATNSGGPVERFRMEALALFEVCEMHVGPVSWLKPNPPQNCQEIPVTGLWSNAKVTGNGQGELGTIVSPFGGPGFDDEVTTIDNTCREMVALYPRSSRYSCNFTTTVLTLTYTDAYERGFASHYELNPGQVAVTEDYQISGGVLIAIDPATESDQEDDDESRPEQVRADPSSRHIPSCPPNALAIIAQWRATQDTIISPPYP
jgi:hypothetical protein